MDNEKLLFENFKVPEPNDREIFEEYKDDLHFGDRSFSLIYAWQKSFKYAFKKVENSLAVIEKDMDKNVNVIVFNKSDSHLPVVISELYKLFNKYGFDLRFEYMAEEELDKYISAAMDCGFTPVIVSHTHDSDYIYEAESFISLEGGDNKGKRGDINYFLRNYPHVYIEDHTAENNLLPKCIGIFDKWCSGRNCKDCIYSCEKTAFLRLMEVFDESRHRLCVAFSDDKPLSFAVSEVLNHNTVCYYFQKNAERIRGLTYWLNREMVLDHREIKYINLGEDMGLEGLRADKKKLRPNFLKHKYTLIIKGANE